MKQGVFGGPNQLKTSCWLHRPVNLVSISASHEVRIGVPGKDVGQIVLLVHLQNHGATNVGRRIDVAAAVGCNDAVGIAMILGVCREILKAELPWAGNGLRQQAQRLERSTKLVGALHVKVDDVRISVNEANQLYAVVFAHADFSQIKQP